MSPFYGCAFAVLKRHLRTQVPSIRGHRRQNGFSKRPIVVGIDNKTFFQYWIFFNDGGAGFSMIGLDSALQSGRLVLYL
ncbi:hypothetical protein B2D07_07770 [Desulfococcus multivorans]|jgi:hypothetical protein|nr:hypothetical protein B2D07_07770 [Desulfococcus multivorans]